MVCSGRILGRNIAYQGGTPQILSNEGPITLLEMPRYWLRAQHKHPLNTIWPIFDLTVYGSPNSGIFSCGWCPRYSKPAKPIQQKLWSGMSVAPSLQHHAGHLAGPDSSNSTGCVWTIPTSIPPKRDRWFVVDNPNTPRTRPISFLNNSHTPSKKSIIDFWKVDNFNRKSIILMNNW